MTCVEFGGFCRVVWVLEVAPFIFFFAPVFFLFFLLFFDEPAATFKELPIKTAKLASLCEELHLAGRKLSELGEDFRLVSPDDLRSPFMSAQK